MTKIKGCFITARGLVTLGLMLGFVLGTSKQSLAGKFSVYPGGVNLSAKASSGLLTVENQGNLPLRLQLSTFAWAQNPQGKNQLSPTQDIVVFPSLLNLKPGEERKIRVGRLMPVGEREKAYRVYIEEIPTLKPQAPNLQINFLIKYGIPVLVAPAKSVVEGAIENLAVESGRVSFELKNLGNVHLSIPAIEVKGTNAAGNVVLSKQLQREYILTGNTRNYVLKLPQKDCSQIKSLTVEVQVKQPTQQLKTLQQQIPLPNGACRL